MLESGEPVVFMMFVCFVFLFNTCRTLSEFCLLSVSLFYFILFFILFTLFSDWTVSRPFVDVVFPGRLFIRGQFWLGV